MRPAAARSPYTFLTNCLSTYIATPIGGLLPQGAVNADPEDRPILSLLPGAQHAAAHSPSEA